ncbi:MAG: hypothetical protein EXS13_07225 [Planctomycetes bacterium]|nr:hypothetical protein [Planctomycetota bacterium]
MNRASTTLFPRRLARQLPRLLPLLLVANCVWFDRVPKDPPPAFAGHAPDRLDRPTTPPRFFAFGDFGTGGRGQKRVAAGLAARAHTAAPDFLLLLGDNFYPDGVASVDDPLWQTHFEQPYADATLQVPCYVVLGNHDHDGSTQAQLDYALTDPNWLLPAPWYEFRVALQGGGTADFFALDTTQLLDDTPVAETQLQWLADALHQSSSRWQIVVGHHSVRSSKRRGVGGFRNRLEPVLLAYGVDLGIFGHDHVSEWLTPSGGLHVAVAGGGGGSDNDSELEPSVISEWSATGGGFAEVTLGDDRIVVEFCDGDGATQRRFEVTGGDR